MNMWNPSKFQNRQQLKYSQLNITISITGQKFSFLIHIQNYFWCQWKFCIKIKVQNKKKYLKPSSYRLLNLQVIFLLPLASSMQITLEAGVNLSLEVHDSLVPGFIIQCTFKYSDSAMRLSKSVLWTLRMNK